MTDIQQLMQMGQQLQAKMAQLQEDLAAREISASSGGGMVTATVDGKGSVSRLVIDPTVVDARDVEMLEDLVLAAITEAQSKAQGQYEEDMRKAAGGMPIQLPGLF
ncbi:MAG TPA: YbaB/EbfC family nucleoid-associated protein [Gemmatimonadetes bacterium]|jgi:DNA-binding YbaB/EbfC family protein|nr:YbaB/EbfC family nucleoid-associated protein [Gemmatimonadota bacterium]